MKAVSMHEVIAETAAPFRFELVVADQIGEVVVSTATPNLIVSGTAVYGRRDPTSVNVPFTVAVPFSLITGALNDVMTGATLVIVVAVLLAAGKRRNHTPPDWYPPRYRNNDPFPTRFHRRPPAGATAKLVAELGRGP